MSPSTVSSGPNGSPKSDAASAPDPKALIKLEALEPRLARPVNAEGWDKLSARTAPLVADGERRLAERDYVGAAEAFDRAAGYEPDNPRIRRGLGLAYAASNPGRAYRNLLQAAEKAPDDLEVQYTIGRLAAMQKQTARAVLAFRTALLTTGAKPSDPLAAESLLRLAELLEQEGYLAAASECYDTLSQWLDQHESEYRDTSLLRSILLAPEALLSRRGILLVRLRQFDRAATLLQQAYDRNRAHLPTARALMEALGGSGQYAKAQKMLLDLTEIEDARSQAGVFAAMLARQMALAGHAPEAMAMSAQLLARKPNVDWNTRQALAWVLESSGDKGLVRSFAAGVKDPDDWASHYVAAEAARIAGDNDTAKQHFNAALAARPSFLRAYEGLLDIAIAAKQRTEIDAILDRVSKTGDDDHMAYYLRGKVELARSNVLLAINSLQQARQRQPRHLPTLLLLAEAYETAGQLQNASHTLLEAMSVDPDSLDVYRRLYHVYYAQGMYAEAQAAADKLIARYPQLLIGRIMTAELNLAAGRLEQARKDIAQLTAAAPNDPNVRMLALRLELGASVATMPAADFDRVIERLGQIIAGDPANLAPKRMLAEILLKRGQNAKAAEVLGQLYRQTGQQDIGKAYVLALDAAGRTQEAIEQLQKRLDAEPNDLWTQQQMLAILDRLGQTDRIMELLPKWLEQIGDERIKLQYRSRLLRLYAKAHRTDDAVKLVDDWIKATPEETVATGLRGAKLALLCEAKRYSDAIDFAASWSPRTRLVLRGALRANLILAELDKATAQKASDLHMRWFEQQPPGAGPLTKDSDHAIALIMLARAGKFDKALADAKEWAVQEPLSSVPNYAVMLILEDAGRIDQALAALLDRLKDLEAQAATQPGPPDEESAGADQNDEGDDRAPAPSDEPPTDAQKRADLVAWCRAHALSMCLRHEMFDKAVELCDRFIETQPKNIEFFEIKAEALSSLGKESQSIAVLREALKIKPDAVTLCNGLGYGLADAGIELDEAERLIRKALAARPQSVAIQDSLAWVFYKTARFDEAMRLFEQILAREQTDQVPLTEAVIFDHIGDTYYRLGRKDQAAAMWNRALEAGKDNKFPLRETKSAWKQAAAKLSALKSGAEIRVAPLGKGVAAPPASEPASRPH